MVQVRLLCSPDLKIPSMQLSRYMKENITGRETVLLNLPNELEPIIREYSKGVTSYNKLIEKALFENIIPEPIGAWEYTAKPVLESLPLIVKKHPEVKIKCYSNSSLKNAEMQAASKQARLTLRTIITNKVEHSKWRETLNQSLKIEKHALKIEGGEIINKTAKGSWVIDGFSCGKTKKMLKEAGIQAKCLYFGLPYYFNPLMTLKRKMAKHPVQDNELKKHVLNHIKYVKDYLYAERNRDIAHYRWSRDNFPMMLSKMEEKEIAILDKIL